ncbi:hypothetical protein BC828DRAFT_390972 [Blastocladiella britannica]|nr:hypothetical protein BC828DRAFT_390972 [Blastocladiella britannica]
MVRPACLPILSALAASCARSSSSQNVASSPHRPVAPSSSVGSGLPADCQFRTQSAAAPSRWLTTKRISWVLWAASAASAVGTGLRWWWCSM